MRTALGQYLRDTGTSATWLARRVGCSRSKAWNWTIGTTGMSEADKREVLAILRERAAIDLDGLLDDQPEFHWPEPSGPRQDGTPFERFLRER